MEPYLIARLQVWNRGYGQGVIAASDLDVDARPGEIEARIRTCVGKAAAEQEQSKKTNVPLVPKRHDSSLDAAGL